MATGTEQLVVRYGRTRWHSFLEADGVAMRETLARIYADKDHVGSIEIAEYRVPGWVDRDRFLDAMDSHSSATYDLAEVLLAHWEDPSCIAEHGNLVELRRAWMLPTRSGRSRLGAALNIVLDQLFHERALLILKAFPLEYEGEVTPENERLFRRRQNAMKRRYHAILGVDALPGESGQTGWMVSIPQQLRAVISPATDLGTE